MTVVSWYPSWYPRAIYDLNLPCSLAMLAQRHVKRVAQCATFGASPTQVGRLMHAVFHLLHNMKNARDARHALV